MILINIQGDRFSKLYFQISIYQLYFQISIIFSNIKSIFKHKILGNHSQPSPISQSKRGHFEEMVSNLVNPHLKIILRWKLEFLFGRGCLIHMAWFKLDCIILKQWHFKVLTHWGHVMHICIGKLTIIDPDNGLSAPGRRQAIIWTNAGILSIGTLGTNLSKILIALQIFSMKNIHLKMSSAKWFPFCLDLNVLSMGSWLCTSFGLPIRIFFAAMEVVDNYKWWGHRPAYWGPHVHYIPRINTLRPEQNGHHFTDIFKHIILNENVCILIAENCW